MERNSNKNCYEIGNERYTPHPSIYLRVYWDETCFAGYK
jgi:hypothetical protein